MSPSIASLQSSCGQQELILHRYHLRPVIYQWQYLMFLFLPQKLWKGIFLSMWYDLKSTLSMVYQSPRLPKESCLWGSTWCWFCGQVEAERPCKNLFIWPLLQVSIVHTAGVQVLPHESTLQSHYLQFLLLHKQSTIWISVNGNFKTKGIPNKLKYKRHTKKRVNNNKPNYICFLQQFPYLLVSLIFVNFVNL